MFRDASSPIGFTKPKLDYDRKAISEPINIRRIRDRLQSLPLCSYDIEPTTQYDIITRQIRTILAEVCPPPRSKNIWRRSCITDATMWRIQLKGRLHRDSNQCGRRIRNARLRTTFDAWFYTFRTVPTTFPTQPKDVLSAAPITFTSNGRSHPTSTSALALTSNGPSGLTGPTSLSGTREISPSPPKAPSLRNYSTQLTGSAFGPDLFPPPCIGRRDACRRRFCCRQQCCRPLQPTYLRYYH